MPDKDISTLTTTTAHGKVAGTVDGALRNWLTIEWTLNRLSQILAETGTARTLTEADEGTLIVQTNSGASVIEIPNDATMPNWPIRGRCSVMREGTGSLTVRIVSGSGVTLRDAGRPKLRVQGSVCELVKVAANKWVVTGDMSAT